jgi:hypothetical protein
MGRNKMNEEKIARALGASKSVNLKTGEVKKTINEWGKFYGIRVLDPDGFDRSDPNLYTKLFTKEEFKKGLPFCTVDHVGDVREILEDEK